MKKEKVKNRWKQRKKNQKFLLHAHIYTQCIPYNLLQVVSFLLIYRFLLHLQFVIIFWFSLQVGVFYLQKWTNPLPNIFIDTWLGKGQLNLHIKSNIMSSVRFSLSGSPLVPDFYPARLSFISTKLTLVWTINNSKP